MQDKEENLQHKDEKHQDNDEALQEKGEKRGEHHVAEEIKNEVERVVLPSNDPVSRGNRRRDAKKFLTVYGIVLFSIAVFIIFLSYISQLRSREDIARLSEDLQASTDMTSGVLEKAEAYEKIAAELSDKVEQLQEQLDTQEEQLRSLTAARDEAEAERDAALAASEEAGQKARSLDLLWQLERAYRAKEYDEARDLVTAIEGDGLAACYDGAALDEYAAIRDKLAE